MLGLAMRSKRGSRENYTMFCCVVKREPCGDFGRWMCDASFVAMGATQNANTRGTQTRTLPGTTSYRALAATHEMFRSSTAATSKMMRSLCCPLGTTSLYRKYTSTWLIGTVLLQSVGASRYWDHTSVGGGVGEG